MWTHCSLGAGSLIWQEIRLRYSLPSLTQFSMVNLVLRHPPGRICRTEAVPTVVEERVTDYLMVLYIYNFLEFRFMELVVSVWNCSLLSCQSSQVPDGWKKRQMSSIFKKGKEDSWTHIGQPCLMLQKGYGAISPRSYFLKRDKKVTRSSETYLLRANRVCLTPLLSKMRWMAVCLGRGQWMPCTLIFI